MIGGVKIFGFYVWEFVNFRFVDDLLLVGLFYEWRDPSRARDDVLARGVGALLLIGLSYLERSFAMIGVAACECRPTALYPRFVKRIFFRVSLKITAEHPTRRVLFFPIRFPVTIFVIL